MTIEELAELKAELLVNQISFCKTFYKLRTGRDFKISNPLMRKSHHLSIIDSFEDVFSGNTNKLIINLPPRYGKTILTIYFIARAMANFPDSNFLYISVSHSLAIDATTEIRNIMLTPEYQKLFDVRLREDSQAKDNFTTTVGGTVKAIGAGGTIVGKGAGIQGSDRFGGAIIIDDIYNPNEVTSENTRRNIRDWFDNTLLSRRSNFEKTPIIYIGHRLHESDLAAELLSTGEWNSIVLPSLDENNYALDPDKHTSEQLLKMKSERPYFFFSQMQQSPQSPGSTLFNVEDFPVLEKMPEILTTFITADTAETDKESNDASVFSLWGLYDVKYKDVSTGMYAIHLLNCVELRVQPADLEDEFMSFYQSSVINKRYPSFAVIEEKSTGVTLISVLKRIQGLNIREVKRSAASGSKSTRFMNIQQYIKKGQVSVPYGMKHTKLFIDHMSKITANDSHAHDDICDTCYDAVNVALIQPLAMSYVADNKETIYTVNNIKKSMNRLCLARRKLW